MPLSIMSFNISDAAVLVVLVIAFLIGLKRGLSDSFRGCIFNLLLLLSALYFASVCANPLLDTPTGSSLYDAIYKWSASWGNEFTMDIYFKDGAAMVVNSSGELVALSTVASNPILGTIVSFLAPKLLPPEGGYSLADAIVPNFVAIIFAIILIIVFFIALKIATKIIGALIQKLVDNHPKLKGLDRFLGGIMSTLMGIVFILTIFGIIGTLGNLPFVCVAADYIKNSSFAPLVFSSNPILTLFINMFGAIGA